MLNWYIFQSSQTHVVTHFQFHDWNEHGGVPETTSELLCLIEHVHSTHNEAVKKEPFVVHCR